MGKKKVIFTSCNSFFVCPLCGYKTSGERGRRLHFKYSHQIEGWKESEYAGAACLYCGKIIAECSCVSHTGRV